MAAKSFKRINPVLEIIGRDYEEVREVPIDEIKTGTPFIELFSIKDDVYEAILNSIKENGYDKAQPLIVWRQQDILIDGHTRLKAAKAAREEGIKNLDYIPIIEKSFENEDAALDYMYRLQFARRNIKDGELILLAQKALEKYEKSYGEGEKPEYLAKRFPGLSIGKAKQIIRIAPKITEEQLNDLTDEKETINSIFNKMKLKTDSTIRIEQDKISPVKTPKEEAPAEQAEKNPSEYSVYLHEQTIFIEQGGARFKAVVFPYKKIFSKIGDDVLALVKSAYETEI